MSDGRPVRPRRSKYEREMCEVDEEGEDHEGGAEGEGLVPKIKKIVAKPTAAEVEQHMATHIPFRDWCPH